MTNSKIYKKYYQNKSFVYDIFLKHKKFLFIFGLCCVFCIILAISTIVQKCEQLDFTNLLDKNLYAYLIGEISSASMLFKYILEYTFVMLLVVTACYFRPAIFLSMALMLYRLFKLCFNIGIFAISFSIKGFVFYLIPMILNIAILLLLVLSLCSSMENSMCKKSSNCAINFKIYILVLFMIMGILILNNIIIKIISPILIIII